MPLNPEFEAFLRAAAEAGGPALSEMPPQAAREMYRAMQPPAPEIEVAAVEERSIEGPAGPIGLRIYHPKGEAPHAVLVNFHGGGWVIGDLDTADAQCRGICRGANLVVVSVDYRLAPEHRFPAAAEDCYAATRWVSEHAAEIGADAERLAVGGDSAGGNLAAVVSLMARDRGAPAIAFQLLVYPVTDAALDTQSYADNADGYLLTRDSMRWFWDHYAPTASDRAHPYASPLRAEDLSNLPPALVMTAEFDPLRDEGEAYGRALQAAGVAADVRRYDGMIHGFFAMAHQFPSAAPGMAEACTALRRALG